MREQKDNNLDLEKLDSARKRLQENYQEAQNGNNFIDVLSCTFRFNFAVNIEDTKLSSIPQNGILNSAERRK
jgi:hypothetical protein